MASVEELCDNIALINNSQTVLSGSIHDIKEKYKSNIFEIAYRAKENLQLSQIDYSINSLKDIRDVHYSTVKINNGKTPNELLQQILPQAQVVSFKEVLPSINDIFIQEVSKIKTMNKILLIIQREYLSRVKKRSFIVMTIIGPILMAAMIILPAFLADWSEATEKRVAVLDETGWFLEKFKDQDNITFYYVFDDLETEKRML